VAGEIRGLQENSVPVPHCPSCIPHDCPGPLW